MIGTNRDLREIGHILDHEILHLQQLAAETSAPGWVHRRLALTCRQRMSICAALVNRRAKAANKVVVFVRWVSGGGALGSEAGLPRTVPSADKWSPWRLAAPSELSGR